MLLAIETHYRGPTDTRGSRIGARLMADHSKRVSVPYDHAATHSERHARAARALAAKLGHWNSSLDNRLRYCGESTHGQVFSFDTSGE